MHDLSQFNAGGRRQAARLLALLLPCVLVVALSWGLSTVNHVQADAILLYVDGASGQDTVTCGAMATPCQTISYALNTQASSGNVLRVALGTYTENLTVTLGVVLEGGYEAVGWTRDVARYETIIDGSGWAQISGNRNSGEHDSPAVNTAVPSSAVDDWGPPVVYFGPGSEKAVLDGFTITGGDGSGGVWIENTSASVLNAIVIGNVNQMEWGGGIHVRDEATVLIADTTIVNNVSGSAGGLGVMHSSVVTLENSLIENNSTSWGAGGGIALWWGADITIYDSVLRNNHTETSGGGIHVSDGASASLKDVLVVGNTAYGQGAGVDVHLQSNLLMEDSLMLGNQAGNHGSALNAWQATVVFTNVVVAGNGHATLAINETTFTALHSTVVDNAPEGNALLDFDNPSTITLLNSIVWNSGSIACGANGGVCDITYSLVQGGWPGNGNLDANPRFIDATNGNYRLLSYSPAIDAGAAQGAADHDLDGNQRPLNVGFDMGAYEFTGAPTPNIGDRYVSSYGNNVGPNLCLNLHQPCATIQHALDFANAGEIVLVAGGVYTENLAVASSVTIVGGLDPATWNRDLSVYETIVNGARVAAQQTDHHPVVEVVSEQAEVVLDGLTLTGGGGELAGGVLAGNAAVTIRNCMIHHNYADGDENSQAGAGVLAYGSRALVIENSRIVSNTLGMRPGGAAGIRTHLTPLTLVNSVVADNRGEMAVHANAPVTIIHSTIANNDSGVLINPPEAAMLKVINSIIHDSEWSIELGEQGFADVRYTLVEGGYDGEGNLDADPQFVDAANDNYELQANSPAVNAGTANYPNPLSTDLQGRTRDWQPDMGAYELPLVEHDASARGVVVPAIAAVGRVLQPAAAVLNAGAAMIENPTPVRCTIALDDTLLYTQTVATAAPWAPFVWQSLEFPPFTPMEAGVYAVTCVTQLPGDERPENDSHTQTLAVVNDAADGWSKDNPTDTGVIPSALDDWYQSPDIWVRHADDNGVVHQDPIAGVPNYVYARLRNRGTEAFTGTVELSWIAPSMGARCGDWAPIGAIPFTNLQPGEIRVVKTAWTPTQAGHTCLQALQDSADDPYNRALECTPLWVPWDNNLAWRNVNIFDNQAVQGSSVTNQAATLDVINPYNTAQSVDVIADKQRWPVGGVVLLTLPGELFARWQAAGAPGENIEVLTATQQVHLTAGAQSILRELPLNAGESATIDASFTGPAGADFMLAFTAQIQSATIGGVSYRWIVDATPPTVQSATPAPDSTAVAVNAPFELTFSRAMDPNSLTLEVNPPLAGWQASWNEAKTIATITHDSLRDGVAYTVMALAFDDNSIALAAPYVWSFRTEARIYLPTVAR